MERSFILSIAILISFQDFLNEWVWNPMWTIYVLLAILISDLFFGVALSFKRHQGFSTRKFKIWILTCFGFIFILGATYNFPRINDALYFPMISPVLVVISRCFYLLMLFETCVSAGKNLVLLGGIKGRVAEWFTRYVDTGKNRVEAILKEQIDQIGNDK